MSYAVLLLAMHPEYQDLIFDEVKMVLPKKDSQQFLSYEDISNIKVLDLVLKEAMRLFPPAHVVARETTSPLDLSE